MYIFFDKFLKNLKYYYLKNFFKAYNGCKAKSLYKDGKNGKSLILRVPLKTKIINIILFKKNLKKILISKGGKPGISSIYYKKNKLGYPGKSKKLIFILRIFINFLLIGLFNSGKSSFFINFLKKKKNNISYYNFSTNNIYIFFFTVNNKKYNVLDDFNLFIKSINFYLEYIKFLNFIKIKNLLYFINFFYFNKIKFSFKNLNKKIYVFNKLLFYKPIYLIFSKIDLLKKSNLDWFLKNFSFKFFFNWNYIVFFNTMFIKNWFFQTIKKIL